MAEGVNNSFNNPKFNVGVIIPPDKINRAILFSDKEASGNIKNAQYDVYLNTKKISFEDRYKTPKSIWYTLGAAAIAMLIPAARKFIKK